ncbi:Rne/Rng family ribonuclease, partial [Pseudomonas syringae]
LEHLLCDSCPTCHGRGFVKTAETVCYEIFREMMRFTRTYPHQTGFVVVASPVVIDRLLTEEATAVEDLSHLLDRTIKLQVETLYTQEQYDIIFG